MKRPLRILISSGPTREPIDPIRFISNYSTGYMGAQLAAETLARGHWATVVSGPTTESLPTGARVISVENAGEMERALRREAREADVIIMAAAVSDFRPVRPASAKLQRRSRMTLRLEPTPDIIARLPRSSNQVVVGFALETDHVLSRAQRKLHAKRLDLLLAQHVRPRAVLRPARPGTHDWRAGERSRRTQQANGEGLPFGRRKVRAWLLMRGGKARALGRLSKPAVARVLLDKIEALWYGQPRTKPERKTVDVALAAAR